MCFHSGAKVGALSIAASAILLAANTAGPATEGSVDAATASGGRFQCSVLASLGAVHRKDLEPEIMRLARRGADYGREAAKTLAVTAKAAGRAPAGSLTAFYLEMPPDFMIGVTFNSAQTQVYSLLYASVPSAPGESVSAREQRFAVFAAKEFDRRDCASQD